MKIKKQEVLRYLGYRRKQELTAEVEALVELGIEEVLAIAQPKFIYQIFPIQVNEVRQQIQVVGTTFTFTGQDAYNHLQKAEKVALLITTLGIAIEKKIRQYEVMDLTKALILDACGTAYIEEVCNRAECQIEADPAATGLFLNRRFSPGYGDCPLSCQKDFLTIMQAQQRLGLTLTESNLMIPRKSVTAFSGLFQVKEDARPRRKRLDCLDCSLNTCTYRRGGKTC